MSAQVLIVDGHSIIFAWPELSKLHRKRTSRARDSLVKTLTDYQDYTGVHVAVVFDGQGGKSSEITEKIGIQVFYSAAGQTADDIIEWLVAKYGRKWVIQVATGDLMEQQTAISFGAMCVSPVGLKEMIEEARINFSDRLKRHNKG